MLDASTEAKIIRIEITKAKPAFSGQNYGAAGTFERLTSHARGMADSKPSSGANPDPGRTTSPIPSVT